MATTQRERLLEVITTNVRHLVNLGSLSSFRRLEGVEELTGWMSNLTHSTHEQLGQGIIALATIADRETLIQLAHGAVFYRHIRRSGHDGRRSLSKPGDWERANMLADDALRACGVDVDKRNAKEARDEQIQRAKRQEARAA